MNTHYMNVQVKIGDDEKRQSYGYSPTISFSIDEKIPTGVEPIQYCRQRLREEINRHSSTSNFDWEDVENPDDQI